VTEWRKSSYSGGPNDDACVELAHLGPHIAIRDSKAPDRGRINLARESFAVMLERVKRGELAL